MPKLRNAIAWMLFTAASLNPASAGDVVVGINMANVKRLDTTQAARDPSIPEFCFCSFCLKSEDDVKYLIGGPGNIFIVL